MAERYQAAKDMLQQIVDPKSPDVALLNSMISELSIDAMMDAVERARVARAPPHDPVKFEAQNRLYALRQEWNQLARFINQNHSYVAHARTTLRHRLLKSFDARCLTKPEIIDDLSGDEFTSASEVVAEEKRFMQCVQWARDVAAKIEGAQNFDKAAPQDKVIRLVDCLVDEFGAFRDRMEALEAHFMALEAVQSQCVRKRRKSAKKDST